MLNIVDSSIEFSFVSIIMPVRNEAVFVEKAVKSLLENDYPSDKLELIVVDGESEDGTFQILEKMAQKDCRIKLIRNPQKIVPPAMNMAIQAAAGKYIVRVDAHAEYASDYLKSCVEVLERTGAAVAGGYMETVAANESPIALAIAEATSSRFGVGGSKFRIGGTQEQEVDTVPFGAFRREVFEKVGYYHPLLVRNQDIELSSRIRRAGFKIIISPKIQLRYYNRATFINLRKQSFANGLWNAYTLWLIGGGLCLRHMIPGLFVLGLIVFGLAALLFKGWFIAPLMVYLAMYLGAGSFEAARIAVKNHSVYQFPLILLAFVQTHIWYGCGTLWGFLSAPFRFRNALSGLNVENAGR